VTKVLLSLSFLFIITGCTNSYSKFYDGKSALEIRDVIISTSKPKLIRCLNVDWAKIEEDDKKMSEDGYALLGVSHFETSEIKQNAAIEHAKKIHADTVFVYSVYTKTISGIKPVIIPNMQTSYHSGRVYGMGGGTANYYGSSTTYGTQPHYIPYHIDKYECYASFWCKAKPPLLGVLFDEWTDEFGKKVESNRGVCIFAVVKGSPAFNGGLLSGDVIRRANGIEIVDKNHFYNWLNETNPSVIDFEISRDGENLSKKVQL
jgi:hypothetical protein